MKIGSKSYWLLEKKDLKKIFKLVKGKPHIEKIAKQKKITFDRKKADLEKESMDKFDKFLERYGE